MVREANLGRFNCVYSLLPDIRDWCYLAAGRFMRYCGIAFVLLLLWGVDSRRTIPVHSLLFDGGCFKRGAALFFTLSRKIIPDKFGGKEKDCLSLSHQTTGKHDPRNPPLRHDSSLQRFTERRFSPHDYRTRERPVHLLRRGPHGERKHRNDASPLRYRNPLHNRRKLMGLRPLYSSQQ